MNTISKAMFPVRSAYNQIASLKDTFDRLQRQLATGERSANLAEMGSSRFFDLTMRSRISRIDAYQNSMKTIGLRLEVMDVTMTRIAELQSTQRTSVVPGNYGNGNSNLSSAPLLAYSRLDEMLTLLNADLSGRYLFGGGKTDQKPVVSAAVAMDGEAGRDGFRVIASERRQADLGATGMGRVGVTTAADTVTLAEDGNHPFGFKLSTLSTSSANITLTPPTGTPPDTLSVQFTTGNLPVAGETVTVTLTLPDGSQEAITLTASDAPEKPGDYEIGVDGDATAAAFAAALTTQVQEMAGTKLAAASTYAAAANFFNGQGEQVMRVDGPPFDTATALVAASAADTVFWYKGEDSVAGRKSVNAKIDDGTTINYGAQANESGLVRLVQTLAAMAEQVYPNDDTASTGRFDAMASRQIERLSEVHNNSAGSIGVMTVELSLAKTTMEYAKERQTSHKATLDGMLADIETIPPEEVSVQILALKTRLEASYETTSLIAQLSLVHYLP
jgi:hypothetical protein